jgi:hypothetical protein
MAPAHRRMGAQAKARRVEFAPTTVFAKAPSLRADKEEAGIRLSVVGGRRPGEDARRAAPERC